MSVRPGLTGMWQIRARTNPSLAVRVRCDLEYIEHWSLRLDLRIAVATILVVLRGEGGQILRTGEVQGSDLGLHPSIRSERL